MTSEQIVKRSDILNTQVITRNNGKRLGVVSQLWVDIDQREVVALSLRDNLLSFGGVPRYMFLSSISQFGDVILVDNEDVIEDIDVEAYSSLINSEVITETGELLGRVRGFQFEGENGKVSSLVIASFGLPQIPDQVLSTYELPVEEIVSTGPNRLIVFEGAEERLNQLTMGVLERLGIGRAPWERDEEDAYFTPTARPENQLSSGVPLQTPKSQPMRSSQSLVENSWEEEEWEQPQPQPRQLRQRAMPYEEDVDEAENWSEATARNRYQEPRYPEAPPYNQKEKAREYNYDDELEGDAWDDEPKPVNIPKKTKAPEYEEEDRY